MTVNELRAGDCLVHNGVAVRLVSFAEATHTDHYWWSQTIFTDKTDAVMMAFPIHGTYRKLHTQGKAA